jgi:hypothetical protein
LRVSLFLTFVNLILPLGFWKGGLRDLMSKEKWILVRKCAARDAPIQAGKRCLLD